MHLCIYVFMYLCISVFLYACAVLHVFLSQVRCLVAQLETNVLPSVWVFAYESQVRGRLLAALAEATATGAPLPSPPPTPLLLLFLSRVAICWSL